MDSELIIMGAIFVMGAVAWLEQHRRGVIRVDENGVLVARSLARSLYLPWDEIDCVGVATVCLIEEGLNRGGGTQYVGVRLTDTSQMKTTKACIDNRRLSDYDVLLTPDRGMPVDQFAAYLEREKTKFKKC